MSSTISLSSSSRNAQNSPVCSNVSSASICKSKFIWRFPPQKFDNLPSCISKQLSKSYVKPLNTDDELIKRQELAVLIYDLGLRLHV